MKKLFIIKKWGFPSSPLHLLNLTLLLVVAWAITLRFLWVRSSLKGCKSSLHFLLWYCKSLFFLYKFLSYLCRGKNIIDVNQASSRVSLYISMRSLIFLLSTNLAPFKWGISFLASLICLINLLKVGLSGGVVMLMTSRYFSIVSPLPLSFF